MPTKPYKKPSELRKPLDCRIHPHTHAAVHAVAKARRTSVGRAVDYLVREAATDKKN